MNRCACGIQSARSDLSGESIDMTVHARRLAVIVPVVILIALGGSGPTQAAVRTPDHSLTWGAVGDSLTLGWGASDGGHSYPADAGIPEDGRFGQCLVSTSCYDPKPLVAAFPAELDGLAADQVNAVVVEIGTNDLPWGVTDRQYRQGYRLLQQEGVDRGVRVVLSTIPPFGPAHEYTDAQEAQRERLNTWIRRRREYVDFAAMLGGDHLAAAYDSGDGQHLGNDGYAVMAAAFTIWAAHLPAPPTTSSDDGSLDPIGR